MNATILNELDELIKRVEKHRAVLRLSPEKFAVRYERYLGSPRSYKDRILTRSFDRLKPERLLAKLRQFVAELDGGTAAEVVFKDLPVMERLSTRFEVLLGQTNDRRCLLFLGATGIGKTISGRAICNDPDYAADTAFVKVLPRWARTPLALVNGVLRAIGAKEQHTYTEAVAELIRQLNAAPKSIFFDDAHYGGVTLLALIKVLIDETSSRFIYMAYPSDWTMLITSSLQASAEAAQLFGRTLKPTFKDYQDGVEERDIAIYLRRTTDLGNDANRTAKRIHELVKSNGNLRLLSDAVDNALTDADEANREVTGADIEFHVRDLCGQKQTNNPAVVQEQEAA